MVASLWVPIRDEISKNIIYISGNELPFIIEKHHSKLIHFCFLLFEMGSGFIKKLHSYFHSKVWLEFGVRKFESNIIFLGQASMARRVMMATTFSERYDGLMKPFSTPTYRHFFPPKGSSPPRIYALFREILSIIHDVIVWLQNCSSGRRRLMAYMVGRLSHQLISRSRRDPELHVEIVWRTKLSFWSAFVPWGFRCWDSELVVLPRMWP